MRSVIVPQCIVNLLLHVKYVLMHFFFFKGVGSDLHLYLKVQQESQYEDRGGLKCSRCSETAVIHGDVLITENANTFISFICFHWFGKSFIILKVKKVEVPKNCHIALHVNSVLPNEGAMSSCGVALGNHLLIQTIFDGLGYSLESRTMTPKSFPV